MPNAPLIIETALLLLAAFLTGSVAGYLLRRLVAGKPQPTAARPEAAPEAVPDAGEQLVTAPHIEPLRVPKLTPAQRLAAVARGRDAGREPGPVPEPDVIQPARVAGQTTSGKLIPAPVPPSAAPEVVPEAPQAAVVASEVPPIDEAAHVVEPERPVLASEVPPIDEAAHVSAAALPDAVAEAGEAGASAPLPGGIAWSELSGTSEEELRARLEIESEKAAMRAVEGGWTPRAARRRGPVELPEPIREAPPAASEQGAASHAAAEAAGALSAARSAVAAAAAAAESALAENAAPVAVPPEPVQSLEASSAPAGAGSRAHAPFGRPDGLPAPRDGGKDELRRIKGVTPQAEAALNALGIFHFDQIAAWDRKAVVWIDNHLSLRGSLVRDKWVEQARDLASSRAPAFRAGAHRAR